ncbi:hypothetical protein D9613_012218 [Agrocybe pediades]|uniref:Uncharacterized protein n=1 Tax=Agrocybe pediades TaxID=84607 RepID=A0A8H4VIX1_9AGAR|nr:hypothetical protein D9613_012218 [Agrocybe pediades]
MIKLKGTIKADSKTGGKIAGAFSGEGMHLTLTGQFDFLPRGFDIADAEVNFDKSEPPSGSMTFSGVIGPWDILLNMKDGVATISGSLEDEYPGGQSLKVTGRVVWTAKEA